MSSEPKSKARSRRTDQPTAESSKSGGEDPDKSRQRARKSKEQNRNSGKVGASHSAAASSPKSKADSTKQSGSRADARPRKTTETPGGLRQTSLYLRPEEFAALYERAAKETAERGVRVSIGEIMRAAIRAYLKVDRRVKD